MCESLYCYNVARSIHNGPFFSLPTPEGLVPLHCSGGVFSPSKKWGLSWSHCFVGQPMGRFSPGHWPRPRSSCYRCFGGRDTHQWFLITGLCHSVWVRPSAVGEKHGGRFVFYCSGFQSFLNRFFRWFIRSSPLADCWQFSGRSCK